MFGVRGRDVDSIAEANGFSGVVRVDRRDDVEFARAYGLAHRGHEIPNTLETQFGTASATKGLTALAVVSLIEEGLLELSTTARSVLGGDLPLIGDDVTIEHLLSHRSGIGDYLDEETVHVTDYVMPVPVHELADDRAIPRDPRRAHDQVSAGRAVRLQQRRVRRARADRRAGERRSVPSARARSRHGAGRDGRHRVPALRRAPGDCGARVSRYGRRRTDECAPPARAGQRRRRDLFDRVRHQLVLARTLRRPDRLGRLGCGDGAAPQRRAGRAAALRPRLLAPRDERRRASWSGPTRAFRSGARTTRSER